MTNQFEIACQCGRRRCEGNLLIVLEEDQYLIGLNDNRDSAEIYLAREGLVELIEGLQKLLEDTK